MPRRPSRLDDLLWDMGDDAYIPHQIAGDEEDELAPVLIATPDVDAPLRALVINLRDAAFDGTSNACWKSCLPTNPRAPLRERWTQYKARGFEVNKHDM